MHTTKLVEDDILDYVYQAARDLGVDRIALLQQMSHVRLARPSDWDMKAVRQALADIRKPWNGWHTPKSTFLLEAEQCWTCYSGERRLYWHHVILVKNGGSSTPRNLVPLCHRCHRAVHPWLPAPTTLENVRGWTKIGDFAGRTLDRMVKAWGAPQPVRNTEPDPPVFF